MSSLSDLRALGARHIDPAIAWRGALLLGSVVYWINLEHGALAALPAALKQATYTFFVGGFITRLSENIAVSVKRKVTALFLAVLVPSTIAIGLTLLLHQLKGTPEPYRSVIPTLLMGPPTFLWWGARKRAGTAPSRLLGG